ncbi:MAG: FadR/GntR family transcriptional regulator [Nakamurella sp.]
MTGADEPQQLHDSVVQRWGWDIVSGALPPGSRIVADEAASKLGVSRTVVREAVRVLDSMGLITVRRRVGITVLPPEHWNPFDPHIIRWRLAGPDRLQHLQSLSELRSAIEPLAARLAADHASPEQCGELTAAVIGMSATARSANAEAYLGYDSNFHRTLLLASGNPMLAGLADVVVEVLAGRTRHSLMPTVAEPRAIALHGEVASAVQSRDGAAAQEAMRAIVAESSTAIQAIHDEPVTPSDVADRAPLPSVLHR